MKMEFGPEERSKRLIERLDRIQNYLQSLPPLPKIGSIIKTEDHSRVLIETEDMSAGSQPCSERTGSAGSSTKKSVSIRQCKSIPKDECDSELLQRSPSATRLTEAPPSQIPSKTSAGVPSSTLSNVGLTRAKNKKKRRKDTRVQDPLKPTSRTSFGVDIGQGMNVINYIKQNAVRGSDAKNRQLAGIITKGTASVVNSDRSLERVYKKDASGASIQLTKNKGDSATKFKSSSGHKQKGFESTRASSPIPTSSESDIYRVKYQERATELPHHHGLDALQELFVPYLEHELYPDRVPSRNESDYE